MAASFTLPTVLANLTAGNQALSLVDGDFSALADPLLALITYSNGYTDTGAANAYVITVSSPQTVAYAAYLTVTIIPANANTGASTLQINALAVKNIFSAGAALVGGELAAGIPAMLIYDGTQWNLLASAKSSEYITASVVSASAVSMANNTAANVTSITLTAGAWDVTGVTALKLDAATTVGLFQTGSTTISAVIPTVGQSVRTTFLAAAPATDMTLTLPMFRFTPTSTKVFYLVAQAVFATSICSGYGYIRASRA